MRWEESITLVNKDCQKQNESCRARTILYKELPCGLKSGTVEFYLHASAAAAQQISGPASLYIYIYI